MTKQEAFRLLNVNGAGLAKLLGINPEAVYQWDELEIPVAREYQIRDLAKGNKPIKRKLKN
ncbi:Cro/CI family transcriptional regulator [Acinetobacter guillouiae]|uniref:Cro/CI family transcriptional regulator n=1 Tax=Acinetobacter guillouiae TaxID=106649 RepID=UPI003AF885BD